MEGGAGTRSRASRPPATVTPMPRPTTCVALSPAMAFTLSSCDAPRRVRRWFPLEEMPESAPARRIHAYPQDEAAIHAAVLDVLASMKYEIGQDNRAGGHVTAHGGLVRYNQALVATGMVLVNGALFTAAFFSGAPLSRGIELDTQHDFGISVRFWRRPEDGATMVRASFIRHRTGAMGSQYLQLEADDDQYEAFFTLLDARLSGAPGGTTP
jgi:hypothetical protein